LGDARSDHSIDDCYVPPPPEWPNCVRGVKKPPDFLESEAGQPSKEARRGRSKAVVRSAKDGAEGTCPAEARPTSKKPVSRAAPRRYRAPKVPAKKAAVKRLKPVAHASSLPPFSRPHESRPITKRSRCTERGLQAFTESDFAASAEGLRNVISRYPTSVSLLERARLYLRVASATRTKGSATRRREDAGRMGLRWHGSLLNAATKAPAASTHPACDRRRRPPSISRATIMRAVVSVRRGDAPNALPSLRLVDSLNPRTGRSPGRIRKLDGLRSGCTFKGSSEAPATDVACSSAVTASERSRTGADGDEYGFQAGADQLSGLMPEITSSSWRPARPPLKIAEPEGPASCGRHPLIDLTCSAPLRSWRQDDRRIGRSAIWRAGFIDVAGQTGAGPRFAVQERAAAAETWSLVAGRHVACGATDTRVGSGCGPC